MDQIAHYNTLALNPEPTPHEQGHGPTGDDITSKREERRGKPSHDDITSNREERRGEPSHDDHYFDSRRSTWAA